LSAPVSAIGADVGPPQAWQMNSFFMGLLVG
jgi:hypothetical protein